MAIRDGECSYRTLINGVLHDRMDEILAEVLKRLEGAFDPKVRKVLLALSVGGKELAQAGQWLEGLDESLCPQVSDETRHKVLDAMIAARIALDEAANDK